MTRPRHRVALIGLGMAIRPHAESWLALSERTEVAWAWSPSQARSAEFAGRYPFPIADGPDQIFDDQRVTIIGVQTPPNTHLDLVRRAAGAGKHVLLEKPLEISTERAVALVEASEAAGVTLGVMLQHRFRPSAMRLRQLLEQGALGGIIGGHVSVLNWREQGYYDQPGRGTRARDGGGVLITQAIHTLDLLLTLTGVPAEVVAHAGTTPVHRMETEDIVTGSLRYASGAQVSLIATTAAYPGFPEAITMFCERGTAEIRGPALTVAWRDARRETFGQESAGGAGADPMDFPSDYHRAAITNFLDAVEAGRAPYASGRAALDVHRLIDALLAAAETGHAMPAGPR
jgi:UDP-N-acetyl-2-amino-2-deoxyglucuronate dehydrogenase